MIQKIIPTQISQTNITITKNTYLPQLRRLLLSLQNAKPIIKKMNSNYKKLQFKNIIERFKKTSQQLIITLKNSVDKVDSINSIQNSKQDSAQNLIPINFQLYNPNPVKQSFNKQNNSEPYTKDYQEQYNSLNSKKSSKIQQMEFILFQSKLPEQSTNYRNKPSNRYNQNVEMTPEKYNSKNLNKITSIQKSYPFRQTQSVYIKFQQSKHIPNQIQETPSKNLKQKPNHEQKQLDKQQTKQQKKLQSKQQSRQDLKQQSKQQPKQQQKQQAKQQHKLQLKQEQKQQPKQQLKQQLKQQPKQESKQQTKQQPKQQPKQKSKQQPKQQQKQQSRSQIFMQQDLNKSNSIQNLDNTYPKYASAIFQKSNEKNLRKSEIRHQIRIIPQQSPYRTQPKVIGVSPIRHQSRVIKHYNNNLLNSDRKSYDGPILYKADISQTRQQTFQDSNKKIILNTKKLNIKPQNIKNFIEATQNQQEFLAVQQLSISYFQQSLNNIDILKNGIFKNLKKLQIQHNRIKTVKSQSIKNFVNLEKLSICATHLIESIDFLTECSFPNLKQLNLQNNKITNIQNLMMCKYLQLQKLNLSSNLIEKIDCISKFNFINLLQLDLSYNQIRTVSAFYDANLPQLQILNLSNNHLISLPFISKNKMKNLKKIQFKNNYMNSQTQKTIRQLLQKQQITSIRIK